MNRIILLILCISLQSTVVVAQTEIDTTGFNGLGIYIPKKIYKFSIWNQNNYILNQIRRTRNRSMLTLALNYSPISFISGWYFDPFKAKDKPYILHADVVSQFAIGGEWFSTPILITPRFKVRIFGEDSEAGDVSLPVRTPSFMPGATIFIPLQKIVAEHSPNVIFSSLSIFHHSNGQDGEEFSAPGVINKYNGNFSNNYVEPALWYRRRLGGGVAKPEEADYHGARFSFIDIFVRFGFEKNFATVKELKSTYGGGHLNLNFGYIKVNHYNDRHRSSRVAFNKPYYKERYRLLFNSSIVTGPRNLDLDKIKKRINIELSLNYVLPGSSYTAGMFSAGYYGSDPYNIYYEDNYFYARVGFSTGLFVAPSRQRQEF